MYLNLGYYSYREFEPMSFWGDRTYLDTLEKLAKKCFTELKICKELYHLDHI